VPAHCVRRADGRYRMVYGPEVEWTGTGRRDEDIAALTQRISSVIEGWVRETPEQWLWLHRRWKTQSLETSSSAIGLEGSPISSDSRPGPVVPSPGRRSAGSVLSPSSDPSPAPDPSLSPKAPH
jgi:hypothetical protein